MAAPQPRDECEFVVGAVGVGVGVGEGDAEGEGEADLHHGPLAGGLGTLYASSP
ncbi:hypothetical protein [Streptomyces virginiae]|uniref:hypothetical protein n=1 Tax=Streptomyces virginiae TaxID=1961 RepID=UPI0034457604